MPPLDPSILIDHIKTQGRCERKGAASHGGGSSLWTLDPHERLLKMPLQKEQVRGPEGCVYFSINSENVHLQKKPRLRRPAGDKSCTHVNALWTLSRYANSTAGYMFHFLAFISSFATAQFKRKKT